MIPPGAATLLPNALLILAAIDAGQLTGADFSQMNGKVGGTVGKDAAWVRRHGKSIASDWRDGAAPQWADLSSRTYCSLRRDGIVLARLLRLADPHEQPPQGCWWCGSSRGPVGDISGCRQLYSCGSVMQWCPDQVPGFPKPEIPPRLRSAQHHGVWFRAFYCSKARRSFDRPNVTSDGVEPIPGMSVDLNRGSGAYGLYQTGTVLAAASGTALVSWPDLPADIIDTSQLITPGAKDDTGLTDYQAKVCAAIREGRLVLANEGGMQVGRVDGAKVRADAMAVMRERGFLAGLAS